MRFWIRELAGWVLIGLGLYVFLACFDILYLPAARGPRLLEAVPLTFIGFVLFRGGIHLLKVAVAARVAMQAVQTTAKPIAVETRITKTDTPWDW